MSKENKPADGGSVTERCVATECKKQVQRMHFCNEHFLWYKEGLINKRGEKPSDFDKKYQNYMRKKAA